MGLQLTATKNTTGIPPGNFNIFHLTTFLMEGQFILKTSGGLILSATARSSGQNNQKTNLQSGLNKWELLIDFSFLL